jgi:hypothetical protein
MPLLIKSNLKRPIHLNRPQTPRRSSIKSLQIDAQLLELIQHLVNFPLPLQVIVAELAIVDARFVLCGPGLVRGELAVERFAEVEELWGG